jgi:MoxR-like ATPase
MLPDDLINATGKPAPEKIELKPSRTLDFLRPEYYQPDPDLADAIRVALLLRKPLLVTGEPGTGKTELGEYIAWKCGWRALQFAAKSDSGWRDLYYMYDALGRFQVKQSGGETDPRDYFRVNALGEAILRSRTEIEEGVRKILPKDFLHEQPEQCVVIIDEIDKASRDLPNDLLNEFDRHFFYIPELNLGPIKADEKLKPVLVFTSNSEKTFPPAFLRRCIYYHIAFPKDPQKMRERMVGIVCRRLVEFRDSDSPLLAETVDLFMALRAAGLNKAPATAELLDAMLALLEFQADVARGLRQQAGLIPKLLVALVKHDADREAASNVVKQWQG